MDLPSCGNHRNLQMNPVLLTPPLPPPPPLRLRSGTRTSSCVNLRYLYSARELRRAKSNNSAAGELLSPALLKWASVDRAAVLTKPQSFEWLRRGWHFFGLTITMLTSGLSNNKEARRCLSAVAASLSSASHEEDSASNSSEGLGPKIDLNLPRRRLQLSFTCDACGARSQRLINPHAYARGTVFVQCAGCEVYHKLVDNLGLIEEYDFRKETNSKADGEDVSEPE